MAAQIWAINLAINFQYPHMIQPVEDIMRPHKWPPVVPCDPCDTLWAPVGALLEPCGFMAYGTDLWVIQNGP